jgi:hypothetical protein
MTAIGNTETFSTAEFKTFVLACYGLNLGDPFSGSLRNALLGPGTGVANTSPKLGCQRLAFLLTVLSFLALLPMYVFLALFSDVAYALSDGEVRFGHGAAVHS